MLVDREFLKKWGACWSELKIAALDRESMTPAEIMADTRIYNSDKNWIICRILISHSREALVSYANFCRDEAKKYKYAYPAAAYAADADDAAAAYAAAAAAYAAAYAADADAAAYAAAAAADAAAYAADAARNKHAARNKQYAIGFTYALSLLPDGGNS